MDRHEVSTANRSCLTTQIARLLHEQNYGLHNNLCIEDLAFALQKNDSLQEIFLACDELQKNTPTALRAHTEPLSELIAALQSTSEKRVKIGDRELALKLNCEKIHLLWHNNELEAAGLLYTQLLENLRDPSLEKTALLWNINNLLAALALDNQNSKTSRSNSLQAMFCARGTGSRRKIEDSEFSLACALSCETPSDRLKDNFVELRSSVLGEESRLEVVQQHLVLLFSARDFSKRKMLASARWILDITTEYSPAMLPAQLHMLYCEEARYHAYKENPKHSRDFLELAENLAKSDSTHSKLCPPDDRIIAHLEDRPPVRADVSVHKKNQLDNFVRSYYQATSQR